MIEVTISHNFETGHRLPHLPGKCQSLHGHSWWAHVTVEADDVDGHGIVVDFGALKAEVRGWIDRELDHGLMLGSEDPLAPILTEHGKVFVVAPWAGGWPTVENVAKIIGNQTQRILGRIPTAAPGVRVARVVVRETHVNEAAWRA